jgi:syntaxin 1B/2/3
MDMSVLVAAQGELLNQIDQHVVYAVDQTGQAVEEMKTAVKIQKEHKKKIFMIIGLGVVVVIVAGVCFYLFT